MTSDPAAPLYHQFPIKIKQCRNGKMMYLETDKYIGQSLDLYGEYCEGEAEVFRQLIFPGHVVIDAGANIGAHTVLFANLVGETGQVHAFEPQTQIHNILCANLALNGLQNVVAHQACVGRDDRPVDMPRMDYGDFNNFGAVFVNDHGMTYEAANLFPVYYQVKTVTLDSLDLDRCDFMKIDVEGMEIEAITGAVRTIERFQPVLYVENDRADKSAELIGLIKGLGYRLYSHNPTYFSAGNHFGNPADIFGGAYAVGLVCLPRPLHQIAMTGFTEV